jgi:hypothetical protein
MRQRPRNCRALIVKVCPRFSNVVKLQSIGVLVFADALGASFVLTESAGALASANALYDEVDPDELKF